ncbi:MAG: LamG domain-containing protein [Patescibacteria group bacterium]|nr:LamG domain-containing protein [Patescibacteria group bacterium]
MKNKIFKLTLALSIFVVAGFFVVKSAKATDQIEPDDLAIWHFDENSGGVAYDSTANHNNLSWGYNPWAAGKILPERQEGRWDLGVNFSQKEEWFSKTFSPAISWPEGLTVGLWLKTDLSSHYNARIFWLGNTLDPKGIPANHLMLTLNQGKVRLYLKQNKVWQEEIISNLSVNDNQWHFVTLQFSANGKATLFIDGQYQAEKDYLLPIPAMEAVAVGRREDYWGSYSTDNFKGMVDEIWIKTRPLTNEEIKQIYLSGNPYQSEATEPELAPVEVKAYYPFDETAGVIAFDQSGNNYNLNWSYNPYGGGQSEPRRVDGRYNGGVNFKKVEDLFSRLNSPAFDFNQGGVIGVWIKTSASSATPSRFFIWGNDEQNKVLKNNLILAENGGKVIFNLNYFDGCDSVKCFSRNYNLTSTSEINDNNWHFVAVTLDPRPYNHKVRLFIDGEPEGEIFFPGNPPLAETLRVGYRENYWCGEEGNFAGDIDDLFILSSVVSADEVKQIYQTNQPFAWPPVKELEPVILVPGIMGSWEVSGKWELDPILHTYDNLWEALKLAGYEEGKNLFAFPYEWRQDNVLSAYQLKQKIDEVKGICNCDKVDIIGHSMGGLVARAYAESDYYGNDIDQLVFLGTPHRGAPEAYLRWEGATGFEGRWGWFVKLIFTQEAYARSYDSLFAYIQNYVKSVEQLLPDFPYLQDGGQIDLRIYDKINFPSSYPYNLFLEDLNSIQKINKLNNQGIKIKNIVGNAGDNTITVIKVISGEPYLPLWQHGYVKETIRLAGDNTVPYMSSSFINPHEKIDADHLALPTEAQKQIIEELTGTEPAEEVRKNIFQKFFMVRIFSPADFVIIAPNGERLGKDFSSSQAINEIEGAFYSGFDSDIEFAVIPDPTDGEYRVELQGTGQGEYKLSASLIDDSKEINKEFNGSIEIGQERAFTITYTATAEDPIGKLEPQDTVPPAVTINMPQSNQQYLRNQDLIIDYSAEDDFSGIATTTIIIDGQEVATTTIDLFDYSLGVHTLVIGALDKAGNSGQAQVNFEIIANIDSTIDDIEEIHERGWLKGKIYQPLLINTLRLLKIEERYFAKEEKLTEKLIEKTEKDKKLNPKQKQKLIDQYNKKLKDLKKNRDKAISRSLDLIEKLLNTAKKLNQINQQGYDIIINNINYLRENL